MRATLSAALLACVGCVQSGLADTAEPPPADEEFYRCEVQPVIAARCAFMDCHGNAERPLPLYAEQRYRLGVSWRDFEDPLTAEELAANFRAVRGFIGRTASDPDLLSEKPLDTRAGGMYHQGKQLYGDDDVFLSRDDIGYGVLRDFIAGSVADPSCIPREEVGQ